MKKLAEMSKMDEFSELHKGSITCLRKISDSKHLFRLMFLNFGCALKSHGEVKLNKTTGWQFPGGSVVERLCAPTAGRRLDPWVGELRSWILAAALAWQKPKIKKVPVLGLHLAD